jgi:hypothetical protein
MCIVGQLGCKGREMAGNGRLAAAALTAAGVLTKWAGTDAPTSEYGCNIDMGNGNSNGFRGADMLVSDQFADNPGYAGSQALSDWANIQNPALTIVTVSSITDCPETDETVACEFPWSNSANPAATDQVGMLVNVNNVDVQGEEIFWTIPSQDAVFHISTANGNLYAKTWFLQSVEGE